jgi:predicted aspartyl protease
VGLETPVTDLTRRALAALTLAAPLAGAARAVLAQSPTEPPRVEDQDSTLQDTGLDRYRRVTAEVFINGQGPFIFIVDSGANRSAITEDVAERLGLPFEAPVVVNTVVGSRLRPTVRVQELRIDGRAQHDMAIPTLALTGAAADGVLGVDWLANRRMTFHFDDQKLEISGPAPPQPVNRETILLEARLQEGRLSLIDAMVSGQAVNAMIDTGAQYTLGNRALQAWAMSRAGVGSAPMRVGVSTVTGERVEGDVLRLPQLRLGKALFENVPVVFADLRLFELWDMERKPALVIGLDLISWFDSVTLDYSRRQVSLNFDPNRAAQVAKGGRIAPPRANKSQISEMDAPTHLR